MALNRRLWIVGIPLALTVYLWFGTHLSFGPIIGSIAETFQQLQTNQAMQADIQAQYDEQVMLLAHADMRSTTAFLNLVPTLMRYTVAHTDATGAPLGMPLLRELPLMITEGTTRVAVINTIPLALLAILAINVVVLPLSAVFLTLLAEAVRGERANVGQWPRRSATVAWALLGYRLLIAGIGVALLLPLALVAALLSAINVGLGALVLTATMVLVFWANIFLWFVPEAIAISGVGPLRAIHASFNIVRRNFWGTLFFLGLWYIITVGTGLIWTALSTTTTGLVLAILGSAYIGTGLWAARMAFYRERLRRWQAVTIGVTS